MVTVIFYETTIEGSVEVGRATFDGKEMVVDENVQWAVEHLLTKAEDPPGALQLAPEVFDGHYFRAEFLGEKGSDYSGNWAHRGGPGSGKGGSTGGTGLTFLGVEPDATREERLAAAEQVRADREMVRDIINQENNQDVEQFVDYELSDLRPGAEETIRENLDSVLEGAPVVIDAPADVAVLILQDGHFKNQHETGTSKGTLAPSYRRGVEEKVFNVEGGDPKNYPIYGCVQDNLTHAAAPGYGDTRFVLKDNVKNRATLTVGDSLGIFDEGRGGATPLTSPGKASWDAQLDKLDTGISNGEMGYFSYFEVQIHGGVKVSDIARIEVVESGLSWKMAEIANLKAAAALKGIEVVEVPYGSVRWMEG